MKRVISGLALVILLFGSPGLCFAAKTQVDRLIEKLVEKDILTQEEAEALKSEVLTEEKEQIAATPNPEPPSWIKDTKIKGDFRLRHEYSKRNDATDLHRNRGRIRYRLALETKITDQVIVGIGLASDGGSPRSTNRSFTDAFDKSSINLDYGYVQYTPTSWLSLTGGKMKIPFWEPADLWWDTDITPEGGAVNLKWKVNDNFNVFSNIDGFVLDEIASDESDPFMYVVQSGFEWEGREKKVDYKLASTYFGFDNGKESLLDNRSSPATNTVTGGRYDFSYNSIAVGSELGINKPFDLSLSRCALIGEYIYNPDPDDNNVGWLVGFYLGDKKVIERGQWQVKGSYRYLGKDVWLDTFPDSDFYGGATDVQGYEGTFEHGLTKNVSLGIDYYRTKRIKATKAPETLLQTDLNFKF